MNNNNINKQKLVDSIVSSSGGKINKNAVNSAVKGDTSALLSGLSAEERQKLTEALNNPAKAKQMLSSDTAKQLLNILMNDGKQNG